MDGLTDVGTESDKPHSWLNHQPKNQQTSDSDGAVDRFLDKYVMYPCNETSFPGFLEHLPCLFKEVNIEGRHALRWAVQAAAYADVSNTKGDLSVGKSLHYYGMALSALSESLAQLGKEPDDYDLMTMVILDLFEVRPLFILPFAERCHGGHVNRVVPAIEWIDNRY